MGAPNVLLRISTSYLVNSKSMETCRQYAKPATNGRGEIRATAKNIGQRIRQDILKKKRVEYGKEIVSAVGRQLPADFGQGFSEKSLWHMIRFAEVFPDEGKLWGRASFYHFLDLEGVGGVGP